MKLNEYKKEYQFYSGKASDVARQLSFAGIAIVWIFKIEAQGITKVPNELFFPLVFFCISLAFDLLHYSLGYFIWYIYFMYKEKRITDPNSEIKHSVILSTPLHICIVIKIVAVIIGYYYLVILIFNSRA